MKRTLEAVMVFVLLVSFPGVSVADAPFLLTPQGARYRDLQAGTGPGAAMGDVVTIHFTGWLDDHGSKGKEIYNTREEQAPVSFVVGTDRVMPGWNEGVIGMRPGGKRLLMLPPALGYGGKSVEDAIPADASLIFIIDLIKLEKQ